MPWRETSAMDERLRFVQDVHRPGWSIAELCRRYEVSRTARMSAADPPRWWMDRIGRMPHPRRPRRVWCD